MAIIITASDLPSDVQSHELVDAMVLGANAKASRVAPCLASTDPVPSPSLLDEARLILIGAVKRWAEAGSGALSTQTAGPFSMGLDTRQRTGFHLWPSEITDLQALCATESAGRQAFSLDTAPTTSTAHLPWCDLMFGGTACSCGADIAGVPIYEQGF